MWHVLVILGTRRHSKNERSQCQLAKSRRRLVATWHRIKVPASALIIKLIKVSHATYSQLITSRSPIVGHA